jgi:hypothetical protein
MVRELRCCSWIWHRLILFGPAESEGRSGSTDQLRTSLLREAIRLRDNRGVKANAWESLLRRSEFRLRKPGSGRIMGFRAWKIGAYGAFGGVCEVEVVPVPISPVEPFGYPADVQPGAQDPVLDIAGHVPRASPFGVTDRSGAGGPEFHSRQGC